jgi:hypothetical protein
MERHPRLLGDTVEEVWREATVMKDRADVIDGQSFKNPAFESLRRGDVSLCAVRDTFQNRRHIRDPIRDVVPTCGLGQAKFSKSHVYSLVYRAAR